MKNATQVVVCPNAGYFRLLARFTALLVLTSVGFLQAQTPEIHSVVSAASFRPRLAPESLASVFGVNLADDTVVATPTDGVYPKRLGGITVRVNGEPAELLFVSPNQVNLIIPASVALGMASVVIERGTTALSEGSGQAPAGKAVEVDRTAPGLFSIGGLRLDRGAVLNGVTFGLDPFKVWTSENGGEDKRTRLSLFGPGFRNGGLDQTTVILTDMLGRFLHLTLEYVGPAPNYPGLDQINGVLEGDWDGLGLVDLQVATGEEISNPISVYFGSQDLLDRSSFPDYTIDTITGTGLPGLEGNGQPAILSRLQSPAAVAIDRFHNLYVADADNHVVRRISVSGTISTFAGTGTEGSSGDGGPAAEAQLRRPVGLAFDALGRLYIADIDDHKVRRIDRNGTISTVAGTGTADFSGDLGPANLAQLNAPAAIAITPANSLLIADSKNHRIRKVTGDGLIVTIAGTGEAGSAEEGDAALASPLHEPNSLAIDGRGAIFIADGLNYRVRRLGHDKRLWTIAGSGEEGNSGDGGPATQARLGRAVQLALGRFGRLFLSDGSNHVVRWVDFDGTIHPLAGTSEPGFAGDGGPALDANLHRPMSLAVDAVMDVFIPGAMNHRVRALHQNMQQDGELCGQIAVIVTEPPVVVGGQTAAGTVRLNCPVAEDTVIGLQSADPAVLPPVSVLIPAGHTTAGFEIQTFPVDETVSVMITANGGGAIATGVLTLVPPSLYQPGLKFELEAQSVIGGDPIAAVAKLGFPAPAGGAMISLEVDDAHATVASSITIPEGLTSLEFLILTSPVAEITPVVLSGATGGETALAPFDILPANGPEPGLITGLSLSPDVVSGGNSSTGTVTLSSPAPENGVLISLSTSQASVSVPASLVIPGGSISHNFPVATTSVEESTVATIVAESVNVVQADLQVEPDGDGPEAAVILDLTLTPSQVTGGSSSTATVTLAEAASARGVLVNLSSSNGAATVPASLVIPSGDTQRTFTVSTSVVGTAVEVSITAQSENSISKPLTIDPGTSGDSPLLGLSLSPKSVTGLLEGSTGTVTLHEAAPQGGLSVSLSSNNAAATVPASVVVAEGLTSATFDVSTSLVLASEQAMITAVAGNSVSDTLTVEPPLPVERTIASFTISPSSVTGGQGATGTITLSQAAPVGGVVVNLSSSSASATVPPTVLIAVGSTSTTVPIATSVVPSTTVANITATSANSLNQSLTIEPILPTSGTLQGLSVNPSTVTGLLQSATGTVSLSSPAPAGGVLVTLSSNNAAAVVPPTLIIPSGQTAGNFSITTTLVLTSTEVTITASSANTADDTLTVEPPLPTDDATIASVTISPTSVTGGLPATGTVTLTEAAPVGGILVSLSSSSIAAVVPPTVLVTVGSSSADFAITTTPVLAATPATITATANNSEEATLTVNPLL